MSEFALVLAFDTDEPEFVRGFEAGGVWTHLQADDERQDFVVHANNAEMMMRMAERAGREVRADTLDDTWVHIFFSPVGGVL